MVSIGNTFLKLIPLLKNKLLNIMNTCESSYEMDFEKEDIEKFALMCYKKLNPTERIIVKSRIGMMDRIPTYAELGKLLGMTGANVRKIEQKAYGKLARIADINFDEFGRFANENFDLSFLRANKRMLIDRRL